METRKQNKELLSGHLSNVWDARESARAEQETACQLPLRSEGATLDSGEQECGLDSGTFLDSAFYSPETVLPSDFLLQTSDSDEREPKISGAARKIERERIDTEEETPQSSHWIGLIASVSVGVVIAFCLFPMLRYAERSTRSYVAESWVGEINRRVGQYEQIYGSQNNAPATEAMQPINLALSGWQELHAEPCSISGKYLAECFAGHAVDGNIDNGSIDTSGLPMEPAIPFGKIIARLKKDSLVMEVPNEFMQGQFLRDTSGLPDHTLLFIPGQENSARSAFGQGILLKDGRVFVRVLPNVEPAM